ncbi:MAG: hypothetical protein CL779_02555 [Chloroflexi bacterium]|nr:hypothetical protein [Chloroflexota bacterium]
MKNLQKLLTTDWINLEHQTAQILQKQEEHGWYFDERSAWELTQTLEEQLRQTEELLQNKYHYFGGSVFTPKRDNRSQGYVAGATFTRLKELNTTSRDHIAWVLENHTKWKPSCFTKTGKTIIDETILKEIGSEVSLMFLQQLETTKKLGMISRGVNAWLKLCTSANRIHHHCSVGAVTHRQIHRKPNLAQVPSDSEFRRLFTATPGQCMVGADLSSIELRMLSHYLARYDSGRYANILINGDIHQENADQIGISRSQVKTITYCYLYGGSDKKIGLSYDKQLSQSEATRKGQEIREAYVNAIPGLKKLTELVKSASKKGYIKALDGRRITVDSPHKALNSLLQGSAAVVAKRWMVINQQNINELKLCASQLAFIHDELQFETSPEHATDLCSSLVLSAAQAGEYYNLRCPIAAQAVRGGTWADTH